MRKILFLVVITLGVFVATSCEKTGDVIALDAKILKELPVMYGKVCEYGKTIVINSQNELDDLFTNDLPKCLSDIDFEKSTVVLGTSGNGRDVYELRHDFKKIDNNHYEYNVFVEYYESSVVINTFICGVIVEKIPSDSEIILTVKEIAK